MQFFHTNQSICVYNMSSKGNYLLSNMPLWAKEADKGITCSHLGTYFVIVTIWESSVFYLLKFSLPMVAYPSNTSEARLCNLGEGVFL